MKILYFGTVCDATRYERLLRGCTRKPTVATVVFESALLEGFRQNGAELEIHSFPMIPSFPESRQFHFGGFTEKLPSGYDCHWLNTLNVPVLKQWSRRCDARRAMKRWCKENVGEGVLLTYSIPPFLTKNMLYFGKKYGIKTVAIVPDLPANMYQNHKKNLLRDWIQERYLAGAVKHQAEFDGYIYLAEAMAEVVAPGKPYTIMEGILNDIGEDGQAVVKSPKRAVMYAGRLHEKYGVMALVDAFQRLDLPDTELWLFGDGTAVEEIQKRAVHNPNIRYFGRVRREDILKKEREATLLVNPRSVNDEYTRYSFPSKTIEYMYSGTPLLTTKLKGIPIEYYKHVFTAEDNVAPFLDQALQEALLLSDEELLQKGMDARRFILMEKNSKKQSEKVIRFIEELLEKTNVVEKKD